MDSETSDAPIASPCPHCAASLAGVPRLARFCPRCGKALIAVPAFEPPEPPTAEEVEASPHAVTLQAYSNAMEHLGWRYEHGHGVFRNKDEAERCYAKSAKLGKQQNT